MIVASRFGHTKFQTPSDGVKYESNRWGALKQSNPLPFVYNDAYNATYDTEAYRQANAKLMAIRMALVLSHVPMPSAILDFGYGNGSFLKVATDHCANCYGYDVAETPYHDGAKWQRVEEIPHKLQVATFWDSLEHTYQPKQQIESVNAEWCFVSLPWAHLTAWGMEHFDGWHHRKPDEHVWHFDRQALYLMFEECGYKPIWSGAIEDEVRKPRRSEKNILTAVFRKK